MTAEKPKSEPHLAPDSAKVKSVDFKNASGEPSANTKSVKRKNAVGGDPAIKDAAHRTQVKARSGARYGISVKFAKQTSPEAGATQANGKIIPSAVGRSKPNFSAGRAE